jgi:dTDP-4-amino-4,6-dideoxygalactose transaminase
MIPFVDLKAQYQSIKEEVDVAVARVLDRSQFVLGEEVEAFESEFAAYCQARCAVGVNNGTSALHLALLAAGIGTGDEVITVSYTFIATAAAIRYTGAQPVFVDIDPRTKTMDAKLLACAITPRTKAILPVHLHGQCAEMDAILEVAKERNLLVIEDAAQAHGAEYQGRRAGSMGDLACFSFYPGKNLGAYGEGGAVVTNRAEYAEAMKVLRDQGQTQKYHHDRLGYNYRLEAMQGAILRVKLRHLDKWNNLRREHAAQYRQMLRDAQVEMLIEMSGSTPVYHLFPVFTSRRDELQRHLQEAGVATGIHYPIPVHLQKSFADLGHRVGDFPHTERASNETLSLPMYPELSREAIAQVSNAIHRFDEAGTAFMQSGMKA